MGIFKQNWYLTKLILVFFGVGNYKTNDHRFTKFTPNV